MALAKICLGPGGKCCLMDSGEVTIKAGDRVVVEGEHGLKLGRVKVVFGDADPQLFPGQIKTMVRLATPEDLAQEEKNRALEKRAAEFCLDRIQAHRLPIYLVQVECLFDASKIIFYFTAPGRVDFRELVKDLVQEFRIRIELRQIGVRHRAKMVGGLGICGRGLCCASHLRDFEPVSVRMAKEQQLSLNPNKISGICGRLMCCLTYEYAVYQEVRKHLPRVGKRVQTPEGEGKIIRYNLIRETVTLELEDKRELEVALKDLPGHDMPAETAEGA
ncbi:MAG: stage 0 sporulation family protein [Deltaproteobacteria bacterium]|nr:stage 0 sporulation family protein [Deltaproteobacteria bacterium]